MLDPFLLVSLHSFYALIEAKSHSLLYEAFRLHSARRAMFIARRHHIDASRFGRADMILSWNFAG